MLSYACVVCKNTGLAIQAASHTGCANPREVGDNFSQCQPMNAVMGKASSKGHGVVLPSTLAIAPFFSCFYQKAESVHEG